MDIATDLDLKIILPEEDLVLNGEKIEIKPFPFGKIPKVITQASMLIQMVLSLPEDLITEDGSINIEDPATAIILASMLESGGDKVFAILAMAANKSVEWVESLPPDEGLLLLVKVWEINKDFFTRRLGPMLQNLKTKKVAQSTLITPTNGEQSSVN